MSEEKLNSEEMLGVVGGTGPTGEPLIGVSLPCPSCGSYNTGCFDRSRRGYAGYICMDCGRKWTIKTFDTGYQGPQ